MVKHENDYQYTRPDNAKKYMDVVWPASAFIISFVLYYLTLSKGMFYNSRAFFTIENSAFVPPESGFHPLYNLFGHIVNLIPGWSNAFSANIFSAVMASVTVLFFCLLIQYLLNIKVASPKALKLQLEQRKLLAAQPKLREGMKDQLDLSARPMHNLIPNIAITALFALSLPLWISAVKADYLTLQTALLMASLYFTFRGLGDEDRPRYFYLGLWFYVLSFANDPILSAYLLPAYIYQLIRFGSGQKRYIGFVATFVLFAICGLSLHLYSLPAKVFSNIDLFRLALKTDLNQYLFDLLTKLNLSQNIFGIEYWDKIKQLAGQLTEHISWPLFLLLPVGIYAAFKILKKDAVYIALLLFGSLIFLFFSSNLHLSNYDLYSSRILLTGILMVLMSVGAIYFLRLTPLNMRTSLYVATVIFAFAAISAEKNFKYADFSNHSGSAMLSKYLFEQGSDKSIYILNDDNLIVPLGYYADNLFPEKKIVLISSSHLSDNGYRRKLLDNYDFVAFPVHFEDPGFEWTSNSLIDFCRLNDEKYIFVQPGSFKMNDNIFLLSGIGYLYNEMNQHQFKSGLHLRQVNLFNEITKSNRHEYYSVKMTTDWMMNIGRYYQNSGRHGMAWAMYEKVLEYDSDNIGNRLYLAAYLAKSKKYKEALKLIAEALEIDSNHQLSRELGKKIVKSMDADGMAYINMENYYDR